MHTFWVTFYSYKGGVGRSMSMANVAAELAQQGRRVLMIDFDLEAPGLDSFEEFRVEKNQPGIVEYVCDYIKTGRPAKVENYVHEIVPDGNRLDGNLWLMTSGAKDEDYNTKRISINWTDLYDKHRGAEFIENFKADIEASFQPDYVFVDSRTGLTDVGGVCTLHLPDLVVLLFGLNEQNLQGSASVAKVLRESEKRPQLLPVATPVPNIPVSVGSPLDERLERAKELIGVEITHTLPYTIGVALREEILVWGEDRSPLTSRYRELAETIKRNDPAGIDFLSRQLKQALDGLEKDRVEELGEILEDEYADRSFAWLQLAEVARYKGDEKNLESCLLKAFEISCTRGDAFLQLESIYRGQKRHNDLVDLIEKFISKAERIDAKTCIELHDEIGGLLMSQGDFQRACQNYNKAAEVAQQDEEFVSMFNRAEASRRNSGTIDTKIWTQLVRDFEQFSLTVSSGGISQRANQTQAIHIAYACIGDIEKAKSLLHDVGSLLRNASPHERIFCVANYQYISTEQFRLFNEEMLTALDKNELWDGMKLAESK